VDVSRLFDLSHIYIYIADRHCGRLFCQMLLLLVLTVIMFCSITGLPSDTPLQGGDIDSRNSKSLYSYCNDDGKTDLYYYDYFWATVLQTGSPYTIAPLSVLSVCLSVLSVTLVYCGIGRIKMELGMEVGLGPGHIGPWPHCVRWGPSSPAPKGTSAPPTFRPMSIVAKRLDRSR